MPLLLVLAMLSACASLGVQTDAPEPSPTPVCTPAAVVEGAEPDLLMVYNGEDYGVYSSTGEEVCPCEYNYVSMLSDDRLCVSKYVADSDDEYSLNANAIMDLNGSLLTGFLFSYIQPETDGSGLIYASYSSTASSAILDADTCQALLALSGSSYLEGVSVSADTFIVYDYQDGVADLYSLSGLRSGNTDPLASADGLAYLRSYDEASGIAAFVMQDNSVLFFGGDGSFEPVTYQGVGGQNYLSDRLIPFVQDGLWGYVGPTGSVVIQPQFDSASAFYDGMAAVLVDGKYGYVDETGTIVISPQYTYAGTFVCGYAVAAGDSGSSFLINKSGETVLTDVDNIFSTNEESGIAQIEGINDGKNPQKHWITDGGSIISILRDDGISPTVGIARKGLCSLYFYDYQTGEDFSTLIRTDTGESLTEDSVYDYFCETSSQLNSLSVDRTGFFVGYRTVHGAQLCDLFDSSGNLVLSGMNDIYSVGEAVAAVKKGFYWGIMDFNGKWIVKQSIFDSFGTTD